MTLMAKRNHTVQGFTISLDAASLWTCSFLLFIEMMHVKPARTLSPLLEAKLTRSAIADTDKFTHVVTSAIQPKGC